MHQRLFNLAASLRLLLQGTTYSDLVCDELDNGEHEEAQDHVQTEANYLTMAETYLTQIPALFFVVAATAWADKHGTEHLGKLGSFYSRSPLQGESESSC